MRRILKQHSELLLVLVCQRRRVFAPIFWLWHCLTPRLAAEIDFCRTTILQVYA
jgi:hypothetical protein